MHKNTFIFLIILAVFAALVVGVNIGRTTSSTNNQTESGRLAPNIAASPAASPTPGKLEFTSEACDFSLSYPDTLTSIDSPGNTLVLVNKADNKDTVVATCQKDIPRPPLPQSKTETIKIGSTSATLYHDASAKDGTPIDELIFRHPKTRLDVYLAGYGPNFDLIIRSLTIN